MKRPSFQFYPGDWLRDTALRSCSVEARGLWMDMLAYMHEGEPYGYLRLNGKVIGPPVLARMVGASTAVVTRLLRELGEAGVPSVDEDGTYYSRRMVRDERKRNVRAAGGVLSLNNPNVPQPKDDRKDVAKDTNKDTFPPAFGGSPASATASSSTSAPQVVEAARELATAANKGLAEHASRPQSRARVLPDHQRTKEAAVVILRAGVPLEFAVAAVYELARNHNADGEVTSLKYFSAAVVRNWYARCAEEGARTAIATTSANSLRRTAVRRNAGEATYANAVAALEVLP